MHRHPIYRANSVILETDAATELSDVLHRWAWNGATGGLVYGEARIGKTQALHQLKSKLVTRDGTVIPLVYFSVALRDVNSIAGIYRLLCNALKLAHSQRDRADYLADTVVYHLIDLADKHHCNFLVLFVDEMQRLNIKQLNIFAELYDRLKLMDITLMTVFVGNAPECQNLVDQTEQTQFAHIRGRFFTQSHKFEGLRSALEVHKCLKQYDTMRYPKDGPTFTEYFLPEPVSKGFEYASLSEDIWHYFSKYVKSNNIRTWGMQYFVATTNCLLLDFLPRHGVDSFGQDMVEAALEMSGVVTSKIRSSL